MEEQHLRAGAGLQNEVAVDQQDLHQGITGVHAVLPAAAPILPLLPPGSQRQPPTALIVP